MSGTTIPLVMGPAGAIATSVTTLQTNLINGVAAVDPGYTANLPGSLIEDMASTGVGILATIDQARVDSVNSVTPYGANAFILAQLGAQFGLPQGTPTNTSAYVIFGGTGSGPNGSGAGTPGLVIPLGTIVSDGTHQYVTQTAAVLGASGFSAEVYVIAVQSGTWAVAVNAINTVVSTVASGVTVTVYNPNTGTPATSAETVQSYRSRLIQAGQVTSAGTVGFVSTLLEAVPGVVARLVAVRQVSGGWEIICGGGDSNAVANAIYQGVLDLSTLQGSTTTARNITVSLSDAGQIYTVIFVNPPLQTVGITASWNTTQTNFTAGNSVSQVCGPALESYINGIHVGQPINLLDATNVFQAAITPFLPINLLTTLTFAVTINGTAVSPTAGTSIIPSDPESYFYITPGTAVVTQL